MYKAILKKASQLTTLAVLLIGLFITSLTTACASGGFKLTREYARFVNSKQIILRIILYIFTSIVFAVTMLIDLVVFNTIDFWEGKVSQGTYEFKEGSKTYQAKHELDSETQLKKSTILITDAETKVIQKVELRELATKEIEFYIDGQMRAKVSNIHSLPVAKLFDTKGSVIEESALWIPTTLTARN